jgi:hypothetical protein
MMLANNDVRRSSHFRLAVRLFEQCGWRATLTSKIWVDGKRVLTATKRNPGQFTHKAWPYSSSGRMNPLTASCGRGAMGI